MPHKVNIRESITYSWHCPTCKRGNVKVRTSHTNALQCEHCGQILFRWLGEEDWKTEQEALTDIENPILNWGCE